MNQTKPLHEQISYSINCSSYTIHTFAQQMNLKLKTLEAYMDGSQVPEKKIISRMNKYLKNKINYLTNNKV